MAGASGPGAIALEYKLDTEPLAAALGRVIVAGSDLTPAMKEIAGYLERTVQFRFESGKGPGGVAWKPSRRVIEEGGQTLVLSGDLKRSIKPAWGSDFAEVGSERSFASAIYAAIHQFGGVIAPKVGKALKFAGRVFARIVMPARPYVGFDDADREASAEILADHLKRAFEGDGA